MTLARRFGLYLVGLHVLFFAFTLVLFAESPGLFVLVELLLVCSLTGGFFLLRQAMAPLDYTRRFQELLQEGHYSARLQAHDAPELQALVGQFNQMLGSLHDERLKAGEQRGFLESLLQATPSAVVVYDFEGRMSLMNASAQALQVSVPLWGQIEAIPLGESHVLTDLQGRRFRGQRGQFFDRGFARQFLLIDELTQELENSERGTYAKLVRVLAHEVNNTVAATGSVLASLGHYSPQLKAQDQDDFNTAIRAVRHRNASLGEFIERFTVVAKMPDPECFPCSLLALLDSIAQLYQEQCKRDGVRVTWLQRDAATEVSLDRHWMEQALVNIFKNALEATVATMRESGGTGEIRLAVVNEGSVVRLSVSDSGNRLDKVPAEQLFSPFFTTKKGGQGIGLLLVRELVQRHGFSYRLAATVDGRTQFDIGCPLTPPAPPRS